MRILASVMLLIGILLFIFAALAYSELRTAATSPTAPSADSMPLTKVVGPELFDPDHAKTKPAALAGIALNRIYMIGGGSALLITIAVLVLVITPTRRSSRQTA